MNFNSHKSWHVHSKENKIKTYSAKQQQLEQDEISFKQNKTIELQRSVEDSQRLNYDFQRGQNQQPVSFIYEAPPGLFDKSPQERPEDQIPDLPENAAARNFLKSAPTKGLWMPLGKEVCAVSGFDFMLQLVLGF